MGLVRIRHGVAQHAMKSRVRAYNNRAKGSGWQANWREHFCRSLTLKTSVFPLSIRLHLGPITSPTIKKSTSVADVDSNQEVGGGAKASGCRMFEWWSSGKKALRTDSLLFTRCSLRTLSFYLGTRMTTLSDSGANTHSFSSSPPATFRSSRQIWPVSELAEQRLNGMQNTCSKGTDWWLAECLAGDPQLPAAGFLCFGFFFIEFHWKLQGSGELSRRAVLEKKAPLTRMFFGDWLHEDRTKQRFRLVASPTLKCEAPGSSWRGRFLFHSSLIFIHTWHIHNSYFFHTWNRFFCIIRCNFVYFSLLGDPSTRVWSPLARNPLNKIDLSVYLSLLHPYTTRTTSSSWKQENPTELCSQSKLNPLSSFPAIPFSAGRICQFLACHQAGLRVLKLWKPGTVT